MMHLKYKFDPDHLHGKAQGEFARKYFGVLKTIFIVEQHGPHL
jgi:hypothetical protein